MPVAKDQAVFNTATGLMKVSIKDINLLKEFESDKFDNPIDVQVTFDNKEKTWDVVCKRQLIVRNLAKQFKVVEDKDGNLYTRWNGYRIDLVPLTLLYKKAGNEVDTNGFDINNLIGFEFDARVMEGKRADGTEYIFIDWLSTLEGNGIETPGVDNPDVYDPDSLRTVIEKFEDLNPKKGVEVKDTISDEDLPF
jgi:hypothetical protein